MESLRDLSNESFKQFFFQDGDTGAGFFHNEIHFPVAGVGDLIGIYQVNRHITRHIVPTRNASRK